jgi:hypothetical protein
MARIFLAIAAVGIYAQGLADYGIGEIIAGSALFACAFAPSKDTPK